jgi:hypothetical protein
MEWIEFAADDDDDVQLWDPRRRIDESQAGSGEAGRYGLCSLWLRSIHSPQQAAQRPTAPVFWKC